MSLVSIIRFVSGSHAVAPRERSDVLLDPLLDEGLLPRTLIDCNDPTTVLTFHTDPEIGLPAPQRLSCGPENLKEHEQMNEKAEEPWVDFNPLWWEPRVISDVIIGLSDGLTVPFALSAGLSALGNTKVVIFGGLAELIAGAISMGLGGYLAARSEA